MIAWRFRNVSSVVIAVVLLHLSEAVAQVPGTRPNVLFIVGDDLRPALGCFGDQTAITPNIDNLAKRGMVFNRAYCQQAVCSPSRLSLLTGRRPDTIPKHFRNNGYHVIGAGKIFHHTAGNHPPNQWGFPAADVS